MEVFSAVPVLLNLTGDAGLAFSGVSGFTSSSCRNPSPRTRVRPCQRHPCWRGCHYCCPQAVGSTGGNPAAVAAMTFLVLRMLSPFWAIGLTCGWLGFLPTGFRFSSGYFSVIFHLSLTAFRLLTTAFRCLKTDRLPLDFNSFVRAFEVSSGHLSLGSIFLWYTRVSNT